MFYSFKNLRKILSLVLGMLLFCSANFLSVRALASLRGPIGETEAYINDKSILRGEIWYGNASWYGSHFQGRKTSNGEKFNKHKLTAAHRYLPFNTRVLVTNLKNKKSVIVRINDRGPFIDNRIIDLSEGAAKKIDLKIEGIAYIKLQVLNPLVENEEISELTGEI